MDYCRGARHELGGFLDVFSDKPEYSLIPAAVLFATPSGPVTADMYAAARDAIIDKIRELDHVDGVFLSLHGAMVTTECDDGEGALLEEIRNEVGADVPIIASLDLHANITERMVRYADALFAFDCNPHVDQYETGRDAGICMYKTLSGQVKPTLRYCKLPLILPLMPTAAPPMKKFVDRQHAYEAEEGVLGVNVCHGFYASDLVEHGVAVIATTDNDPERAQNIADTLGKEIWEDRSRMVRSFYSIDEAIDEALSSDGHPFVFADTSDNPGAGSTSDGTHILRAMLERGVKNAAIATIVDPETVLAAERAGVGNTLEVQLGGKTYPKILGEPISATAYVKMIRDGVYHNRDEMCRGVKFQLGKTAVLTINDIDVIVATNTFQPYDLEVYRVCGIMPEDKKILVTKSSMHYKNSFGKVAYKMLDVEVPGLAPQNPKGVVEGFGRCRRPIYPLDEM